MLLVKKTCIKAYEVGKKIRTDKWTMICFSGVTILLSLTVFSQVLADTMPATSDAIPLLGKNFKSLKMGIQKYIYSLLTIQPNLCMPSCYLHYYHQCGHYILFIKATKSQSNK